MQQLNLVIGPSALFGMEKTMDPQRISIANIRAQQETKETRKLKRASQKKSGDIAATMEDLMVQELQIKGSELPPFTGKLRIYSMRFCPYAQRTHLILSAKKVPYEVVNINLNDKPEWLTSKSPLGKVPAIEITKNVVLYESLITAEYIDDKYVLPRLVSQDPLRKAQDKIIIENFNRVTSTFYKVYTNKDEINDAVLNTFFQALEDVQSELTKRCTKYLAGKSPGMVDYMIWPWFERLEMLSRLDERFTLDKSHFKALDHWMTEMKREPAVKAHYLDTEAHVKFIEGRIRGEVDYDFLL